MSAATIATLALLLAFVWDLSKRVERVRRARKDLRHVSGQMKATWRIFCSALRQLGRAAMAPVFVVGLIWLAYLIGRNE